MRVVAWAPGLGAALSLAGHGFRLVLRFGFGLAPVWQVKLSGFCTGVWLGAGFDLVYESAVLALEMVFGPGWCWCPCGQGSSRVVTLGPCLGPALSWSTRGMSSPWVRSRIQVWFLFAARLAIQPFGRSGFCTGSWPGAGHELIFEWLAPALNLVCGFPSGHEAIPVAARVACLRPALVGGCSGLGYGLGLNFGFGFGIRLVTQPCGFIHGLVV